MQLTKWHFLRIALLHSFEIGTLLIYFFKNRNTTPVDHLTGRHTLRDISTIFLKILTFQGSTKKCQNEETDVTYLVFTSMI